MANLEKVKTDQAILENTNQASSKSKSFDLTAFGKELLEAIKKALKDVADAANNQEIAEKAKIAADKEVTKANTKLKVVLESQANALQNSLKAA